MRISEPSNLMTAVDQCRCYNESLNPAELTEYVNLYKKIINLQSGTIVDLGSGSCNFVIALCLEFPEINVVCYENSDSMIDIAYNNIRNNNLTNRIRIIKDDLFNASGKYDAVLLNRTLHHIDDTSTLWKIINELSDNVLVTDLRRFSSTNELENFIDIIKPLLEPIYLTDTENSFKAAYSYDEVCTQVLPYGYTVKSIDETPTPDISYGRLIIYHTR